MILATASTKAFCGGYDEKGMLTFADALLIPSASNNAGTMKLGASNFCGQGNGFVYKATPAAAAVSAEATVCCKLKFIVQLEIFFSHWVIGFIFAARSVPFRITFVSDTFEGEGTTLGPEWAANQMNTAGTLVNNGGFKIRYTQS